MAIKVGISGFGRISRVVIRIAMSEPDIEIAGINIRNADYDYLVYMLKYDSTFGRFPGEHTKTESQSMAKKFLSTAKATQQIFHGRNAEPNIS